MKEETTKKQPEIKTDFRYAIVAGWLIIPALMILFNLVTVMYVIFTYNPANLGGYDLFVYISDYILAFFYLFIIYTWVKRKKILPKLMIVIYILDILLYLPVIFMGAQMDWIYILISAIWIGYFIRSKRVKATFIN
ncbi:hypothetical protein ACA30_01070 [Virgibacillus soli]|uniref:Uncharacterized protein n=1 Tax=Lederbergia galactosidilytica TaxID=217031 RepID=A0A0Q9XU42_9BACI|nr:hypothetical protein ACA29_14100 [Lederbergia galactosidilytica]KRG16334.1 hypothetical protein ACA30_01070 [Virgibacillus soli]